MYYWKPFVAVSLLWVLFEVYLALKLRAPSNYSKDQGSKNFLWVAIALSLIIGISIAFSGYGFVGCCFKYISIAGIFLITAGLILRMAAVASLGKYFTSDVAIFPEHRLVKTGPYRFLRHPAYAGGILSFLGLSLGFSNWITLLVILPVVSAAFLRRIKIEEKALEERFGQEYEEYRRKTAAIIPWVW